MELQMTWSAVCLSLCQTPIEKKLSVELNRNAFPFDSFAPKRIRGKIQKNAALRFAIIN